MTRGWTHVNCSKNFPYSGKSQVKFCLQWSQHTIQWTQQCQYFSLDLHPLVLLISSLFLSPWPAQVPLNFQASCGSEVDPILLGIKKKYLILPSRQQANLVFIGLTTAPNTSTNWNGITSNWNGYFFLTGIISNYGWPNSSAIKVKSRLQWELGQALKSCSMVTQCLQQEGNIDFSSDVHENQGRSLSWRAWRQPYHCSCTSGHFMWTSDLHDLFV